MCTSKLKRKVSLLILALALMPALQCAGPETTSKYVKDGKEYGKVEGTFRHRWWNFYERAQSFTEGEFYEEAAVDLLEAIGMRKKDQRMARTYGMHFIDYFPHRELGIVYFHMKRYGEAEQELEKSLSMEETGRAKHYLNETRRAILEKSTEDILAPNINISAVSTGETTNSFSLNLEGDVEDDFYAREIIINEKPLFIELSAKRLSFSEEIKLKKGLNEINIKSSDLLGKTTEKKVKVFADFEGPALNIENYHEGQNVGQKRIVLNGALADATGITSLKINDRVLAYNKEKKIKFMVSLELDEGNNRIKLAATDVAGNTTAGDLNLNYIPQLAEHDSILGGYLAGKHEKQEPVLLALNGLGILDNRQHIFFSPKTSKQTGAAFRLNLKELTDSQTVYFDTMYIDGSATGANKINSVNIDESPLLIVPGRTIYFNQLIKLVEGENRFTLKIMDEKGNKITKTITVVYQVPKVHRVSSRMSLAVMPFALKGELSTSGDIIYDNFISALIEQNRFNVVSRGEELEAVLSELKLSQTDLVDKGSAVKVGRLIAAEGILMGSVRETKDSMEVYIRFVNTETSSILEAKDVYIQDKSLSQIQYCTNGLALKLKHSFPLIEGLVIKTSGKDIYADFGSVHNIKREMKFIVFRPGEQIIHPVTKKVLGEETEELGVATVIEVYEDMSIGKLLADFDASKIKIKDMIVTK